MKPQRTVAPLCRVAVLALLTAALTPACSRPGLGTSSTEGLAPTHDDPSAIPVRPVEGTLAGAPFTVHDARFRIDRRPGYEGIDLRLSPGDASAPCAALPEADGAGVWIHFGERTTLEPATIRVKPGTKGEAEAHLFLRREGKWFGNGDAAMLLVIKSFDPAFGMEGDLSVCFADEAKSCVSGSFNAAACPDPLEDSPRTFPPTSLVEVERIRDKLADAGPAASSSSSPPAASSAPKP